MSTTYCLEARAVFSGVPEHYREARVLIPLPDGVSEITPALQRQFEPLVGERLDRMIADAGVEGASLEAVSYQAVPAPESVRRVLGGGDE